MDNKDREILDIMQAEFPLTTRPWGDLAARVGISEAEVMDRVQHLKKAGIIRRIGGIFDSRQLGFYSTLCATRVPEHAINRVAAIINSYPGVTHNYVRDDQYNLWFTLTAPSATIAEEQLAAIEEAAGVEILTLPATRVYKIKVAFKMGGDKS